MLRTIKKNFLGYVGSMLCYFILLSTSYAFGDDYHFVITPFLWNLNMNGEVAVGYREASIDRDKLSGMLFAALSKDEWSVFLNTIYSQQTENYKRTYYSVAAENKLGIFTAGLAYDIEQWPVVHDEYYVNFIHFIPYIGLRYSIKKSEISVTSTWLNRKVSHRQDWTDPLIGLTLQYVINPRFALIVGGDIGGTSRSTDYSYEAIGLLSYTTHAFCPNLSVYAGYQLLKQHYIHGSQSDFFEWNIMLSGPVLGLGLTF